MIRKLYRAISPFLWTACWLVLVFEAVKSSSESPLTTISLLAVATVVPLILLFAVEYAPDKYRNLIMKILGAN